MASEKLREKAFFIRNFIFGVEDSLVSTVGLLSGVVVGGVPKDAVVLVGVVLIFVEALSMGVGSLLSEHSVEVYIKQGEVPLRRSALGGLIMFFSYFVSGFIPLSPYLIFDVNYAFWISIAVSLLSLFLLGAISGRIFHVKVFREGMEMFIIGGAAVVVGVIIGMIIGA